MEPVVEMLTISQASDYLGLTVNTLKYLIKHMKLNYVKQGKTSKILIPKKTLIEFKGNNKLLMDYYLFGAPEGYLSAQMIANRFNVEPSLSKHWINQGRFNNVEILSGMPCGKLSIVPLYSVIEYESRVKTIESSYVRTEETLKLLEISEVTLTRWVKEQKISGTIKWYGLHHYFPLNEITRLKQELDKEKEMITIPEVVRLLGIPHDVISEISLRYRVRSLKGNIHLISKANFKKMKQEHKELITYHRLGIPEDFLSTKILSIRFNVPQLEIVRWIKQGRFKGAKKIGATVYKSSFYIVPKESVYEYEIFISDLNLNYLDVENAVKVLNVSSSTINNWIAKKKFDGMICWLDKWYISKTSIRNVNEEIASKENLYTVLKCCQEFKISRRRLLSFVKNGLLHFKVLNGKSLIDHRELSIVLANRPQKKSINDPNDVWDKAKRHGIIPDGYITINNLSRKLNLGISQIEQLIQSDIINAEPFIIHGRRCKLISSASVETYMNNSRLKGSLLTTVQAAAYLKIDSYNSVSGLVKKGYFPNVILENRRYLIPKDDLDEYVRLKALNLLPKNNTSAKEPRILSKQDLIIELLEKINDFVIPNHLIKTKELYIKYSQLRIASLNGSQRTKMSDCSQIVRAYQTIISNLTRNCFELSDEEIRSILQNDYLPISHRTLVNWFFHFSFQTMGIKREKQFIIVTKINKSANKELYSPEIYLEYIDYVKKVNIHTHEAIKSQHYSNMWLFTLMHLMDAWRPSDIVSELPAINIEDLEINNLDWFRTNELSLEQAQHLINQVYIKTRHSSASKTNALLTFIVPLDMVFAAGTSFLINELHRLKMQDTFLLQTLITENLNAKAPTRQHFGFFKFNEKLKDFKSIVMIRSTMTYLFNSIVEDAPDPELALSYTMSLRSHEKESSTSIYVQSTNRDGSLNRVSLNLFNRGHFGWLFNYIIQQIFANQSISPTFEERTKLISGIRHDLSPQQLENWAAFIRKNNQSKETLITKLLLLSKSEIKELFGQILRGDRPAKDAHGQCFSYPNCDKPQLQSCFYCENFIPQVYLLIELKYELIRLVESIKASNHLTIILRDSEFLKKLLTLLNESVSIYGEAYISSFIDLTDVRESIFEIKDRLFIENTREGNLFVNP